MKFGRIGIRLRFPYGGPAFQGGRLCIDRFANVAAGPGGPEWLWQVAPSWGRRP